MDPLTLLDFRSSHIGEPQMPANFGIGTLVGRDAHAQTITTWS